MDSEDPDVLLAKISQLAGKFATRPPVCQLQLLTKSSLGKINRHKNGQNTDQQSQSIPYAQSNNYGGMEGFTQATDYSTDQKGYQQSSTSWRSSRGGFASRGYPRGGRAPPVHRNRTLVLNGNTPTPGPSASQSNENETSSAGGNNSGSAWVMKQDRHLQLINTSIFEKDSQKRAKAIEQTRQQKLKQRDEREKTKLLRHLQRGNGYNDASIRATGKADNRELDVNGIRFRVTQGGSKLVKVSGEDWPQGASRPIGLGESIMSLQCTGDLNAAKSTPKSALIGGVRFYRSKSGNMYRSGIIKAYRYEQSQVDLIRHSRPRNSANISTGRRSGVVNKINEPCKIFTTTGIPFLLRVAFFYALNH
jgi:hypothetical protein